MSDLPVNHPPRPPQTLSASPVNHPPHTHTHTVSITPALVISSLSTGLADLSAIPAHPIVGKL